MRLVDVGSLHVVADAIDECCIGKVFLVGAILANQALMSWSVDTMKGTWMLKNGSMFLVGQVDWAREKIVERLSKSVTL